MSTNINFTSIHADKRIFERTFFNETSLLKLMDSESYFYLGREIGSNRGHYLVYQSINEECFVVIKDNETDMLITILPLEYHVNFENKLEKEYLIIDDELKRRAKLAHGSKLTANDLKLKIKLKATTSDDFGNETTHDIKVMNFSTKKYLNLTQNSKKAHNILMTWLKKNKGLNVEELFVSIGRGSLPFIFEK